MQMIHAVAMKMNSQDSLVGTFRMIDKKVRLAGRQDLILALDRAAELVNLDAQNTAIHEIIDAINSPSKK